MWRTPAAAAGAAGAFLALIPAPAPAAPDPDRTLLDRYRPQLRYASEEEHFAQPVSLPPELAEVVEGHRVYGHVASEAGERWLQYWFFYAYNPQDRGILRTGRHEGDWELFQIRLGDEGRPDAVTMTQHSWAEGCAWGEIERSGGGLAPVLYVANGSHAVYARPGDHDRPFPDPTDEADGEGREVRPRLSVIDDGSPGWAGYPGRWGTTEDGWVPGESPSPRGPRFQDHGAWAEPATFHSEVARACGAAAPGRWWALPAFAAGCGLLGALGLVGVRALRRRL